jgi:hypothetical protein
MIERSRAECRFLQRLPHRLGADRIDRAQGAHLVGEHARRAVAPAMWRIGTSQFDQFLFNAPLNLDRVGTGWTRFGVKRRLDPRDDNRFVTRATVLGLVPKAVTMSSSRAPSP